MILTKSGIAQLYKSRCYVCHKKFGKRFTFHHLYYLPSDKIYSDFKRQKDYDAYILPVIKSDPKRFMLLCVKCHFSIEQLKRYKKDKFRRLYKAVCLSTEHNA